MEEIVVGVDGSESAELALDFAAEEAAARGALLRVIYAWEVPPPDQDGIPGEPEVFASQQRMAMEIVENAVHRVHELQPDVRCDGELLHGRPQTVLVEQARGAAMVIVGRRGRGGLASILLGSVGQHVVNSACCPVVVVPPLCRLK